MGVAWTTTIRTTFTFLSPIRCRNCTSHLLKWQAHPGHHTVKGNTMRVAVVVAAMFFCAPGFAQGVKLKGVTNSIGMELIEIPVGKFRMGVGGYVAVTLTQGFLLGKTEVTWGEWQQVMG